MDGVITDTASLHARAWKQIFDEFLQQRARRLGRPFQAFSIADDYRRHVDGKPRLQGIEAFLASRGVHLAPGDSEDASSGETIWALGQRKNTAFNELLERSGVSVFPSTVSLIETLRERGVRIGLATSSRNASAVLARSRTADLFAAKVDGVVSAQLGLKGKPQPDIFLTVAHLLNTPAAQAIVVEDAVSGIQAAVAGGFALSIGIAREGNARELSEAGADIVVGDLAELSIGDIDRQVRLKGKSD